MVKTLFFVGLIFFSVSCKKTGDELEPTKFSYRKDTLKGEIVLVPDYIPKSIFYPNDNKSGKLFSRGSITLDELARIVNPYVGKYPNLSNNPIKKEDIERIYHDFPNINSLDSIYSKSDAIVTYYNGLIRYEAEPIINKALIESEKSIPSGRPSQSPFGRLNPREIEVLSTNLSMASRYAYASNRALDVTNERYGAAGLANDGYKGNSFQHTVWNCMIIREALYAGYSKENAILFTRNITSNHEYTEDGSARQYTDHTAMDLHNNLFARSWMRANTGAGAGPFTSMPSEEAIFSYFSGRVTSTSWNACNSAVALPGLYSGGWEYLYGMPYFDFVGSFSMYYILPYSSCM